LLADQPLQRCDPSLIFLQEIGSLRIVVFPIVGRPFYD
jgi:hypothetical protein